MKKAEKLAGLEPMDGTAWHAFRRKFATDRKHLPTQDVARGEGWKDLHTLTQVYQQPDEETQRRRDDLARRDFNNQNPRFVATTRSHMEELPIIGPGSGRELFAELQEWEFFPSAPDEGNPGVFNCDFESLRQASDSLQIASPYRWHPVTSPFSFFASSSLSGEGNPCFHVDCRRERVRALKRFASLYADEVLIRDPFEAMLVAERDTKSLRTEFATRLIMLQELRPEIEAGLIKFAPSVFPFCESGKKQFRRVEDAYRERVFSASTVMLEELIDSLDIRIREKKDYRYVSLEGADAYIPIETLDLVPADATAISRFGKDLSEDVVRNLIQSRVLDPALIDLQFSHVINWLYNTRYLSDRPVDADLLSLLDSARPPQTPSLGTRISHSLPFVDGLDTEDLIRLRCEEGATFRVYRDRVKTLIESDPAPGREFDEAFRDLVMPELNKLDRAVDSAKRIAKRKMKGQLAFGVGTVTIGLAAGTVAPAASAVIAALGGAKFAAELLANLDALVREPDTLRESDFYFLWKAREEAN